MADTGDKLILPDVPPIEMTEYPDVFTDAVNIAMLYASEELKERYPKGLYPHLSGYSGRGWLIGFDEASYYWERHGDKHPHDSFAACSPQAYLEHYDTLRDTIEFVGYEAAFLWNDGCRNGADPAADEVAVNPRSRPAKLRAAEKL